MQKYAMGPTRALSETQQRSAADATLLTIMLRRKALRMSRVAASCLSLRCPMIKALNYTLLSPRKSGDHAVIVPTKRLFDWSKAGYYCRPTSNSFGVTLK